MNIRKERTSKPLFLRSNERLLLSFIEIIRDERYGVIPSTSSLLNSGKGKVIKTLKALLCIRENTLQSLIQIRKTVFCGTEKLDINAWSWNSNCVKSFLQSKNKTFYVIRTGESRIIGYVEGNVFYVSCIEYNLGDIYNHD